LWFFVNQIAKLKARLTASAEKNSMHAKVRF
jgi:hypothetical protein